MLREKSRKQELELWRNPACKLGKRAQRAATKMLTLGVDLWGHTYFRRIDLPEKFDSFNCNKKY